MHIRPSMIALAFLALATTADAQDKHPATQVDDDHVREVVKGYIEAHPDVVFNAVNAYVAETRAKQEKLKNQGILQSDAELSLTAGLPFVGNPDGKVLMVYFLDGACGYCRRSVQALDELVQKNPDLKIVHRWVPFLTPASDYAGRVATVVARRYAKGYPAFYASLMTQNSPLTTDMVDRVVGETLGQDARGPVKQEAVDQADTNSYARSVTTNNALARRLKIDGTPFFYVRGAGADGLISGAVGYDRFAASVAKARQVAEGH